MKTDKKRANQKSAVKKAVKNNAAVFQSREERLAAGRALRDVLPRSAHAVWKPAEKRHDPIHVIEKSNRDRLPDLIPIRYGRMQRSTFTFLRGSAGLMAYDLSTTPDTGIHVQVCGDCHLMNFGLFATPERNLVFDINDFDETIPAPWEWDIKRLAVSFAVAARANKISNGDARKIAVECVRSYRVRMREYSRMNPLEVWYDKMDSAKLIEIAPDAAAKKYRQQITDKARARIGEYLAPKISTEVGGRHRLIDQPPILFHVSDEDYMERVEEALAQFRLTLSDERRVLWDRYRVEDAAIKVVGIGSVGTRCYVALLFSAENHPLLIQVKEARSSVLEPYVKKSIYKNQGQRIVTGQRLMQSSSDIFLGWTRSYLGYDFYARQLRDMKFSVPVESGLTTEQFKRYADLCGWVLARAHAKSGDAATISGYLGKSDVFDQAVGDFSLAYAAQNDRDHAALRTAIQEGRIQALIEEDM